MITILIPIYNGIKYLEESIESVKKQTFKDWELIIGINGHPANSLVYQQALNYKSDKIKIIDFYLTKGKSNTLNEMVKISKYDWIAILDVDDKWHSKKLEIQIRHTKNYDIIGTQTKYFGDLNISPNIPSGDLKKFNFLKFNPIINSSSLIRKEFCFWNVNMELLEDYELWLRLWKQGRKFFNIKDILTYHRIHKKSFFNNNNRQDVLLKELKIKYKN